jgi:hypothetical protein
MLPRRFLDIYLNLGLNTPEFELLVLSVFMSPVCLFLSSLLFLFSNPSVQSTTETFAVWVSVPRWCAVSASPGTRQWRRARRPPPRTPQSGSAATVAGTLNINRQINYVNSIGSHSFLSFTFPQV